MRNKDFEESDDEFISETWCDICKKETQVYFKSGGHERDSSGDYEECLECGYWRYGMCSEWEKP